MFVSDTGESIGIYEMGSLAGSSGVAYQTTHRSPLSYNIDIAKSSPMSELSFGKFGRGNTSEPESELDAKDVIEKHNSSVSSFYNHNISESGSSTASTDNEYDSLFDQLSKFISRSSSSTHNKSSEDHSDISGDIMSQVYYYGISAIMLYLLYRILYVKHK